LADTKLESGKEQEYAFNWLIKEYKC
jgi:hypothetical protein